MFGLTRVKGRLYIEDNLYAGSLAFPALENSTPHSPAVVDGFGYDSYGTPATGREPLWPKAALVAGEIGAGATLLGGVSQGFRHSTRSTADRRRLANREDACGEGHAPRATTKSGHIGRASLNVRA
jgi:hypothetical protein